jgi:hypothetical protein
MKNIAFILFITLFISSCSSRFNVQKRKYNKGFYLGVSKKNKVRKNGLFEKAKIDQASLTDLNEENLDKLNKLSSFSGDDLETALSNSKFISSENNKNTRIRLNHVTSEFKKLKNYQNATQLNEQKKHIITDFKVVSKVDNKNKKGVFLTILKYIAFFFAGLFLIAFIITLIAAIALGEPILILGALLYLALALICGFGGNAIG